MSNHCPKSLHCIQEILLVLCCGFTKMIENAALLWYVENDVPAHRRGWR